MSYDAGGIDEVTGEHNEGMGLWETGTSEATQKASKAGQEKNRNAFNHSLHLSEAADTEI